MTYVLLLVFILTVAMPSTATSTNWTPRQFQNIKYDWRILGKIEIFFSCFGHVFLLFISIDCFSHSVSQKKEMMLFTHTHTQTQKPKSNIIFTFPPFVVCQLIPSRSLHSSSIWFCSSSTCRFFPLLFSLALMFSWLKNRNPNKESQT